MSLDPVAIYARCVEVGDCLLWTGCVNSHQYPTVWDSDTGRAVNARRQLYIQAHGKMGRTELVCVSCDEARCLNLEHLVKRSRKQNMRISANRGRCSRPDANARRIAGKQRHAPKLTMAEVQAIRDRLAAGETRREVAASVGLHVSWVYRIGRNEVWRDGATNASVFHMRA